MTNKERVVQEAIGSLKVIETREVYDVQYMGPVDKELGFVLTINNEQVPFTCFDDMIAYFAEQTKNTVWTAFVPKAADGEIIRDRVKHIEVVIRITHTDA